MSEVNFIIFSKERTLQLYSLVHSVCSLTDAQEADLTVLYRDSMSVPYDGIRAQLGCRFVRERTFLDDVVRLVNEDERPYVCFMVDDLIYRQEFRWRTVTEFMDGRADVDGFSLRLGRNIQDGVLPQFERHENGILVWDTAEGLGLSWRYVWELMSTVYRREHVKRYLSRCLRRFVTYPNSLESFYYNVFPTFCSSRLGFLWRFAPDRWRRDRLACFETSKCLTQGVNLVADRSIEYDTYLSPEAMHQLFLEGCRIDYECLRDIQNHRPNHGRDNFRVLAADGQKHEASYY